MAADDDLDHLLTKLGVGKWNYLFFATSLLVPATIPGLLIGAEFFNPPPDFTCSLPNSNYTSYNGSECLMMEGQKVVPCTSWVYDTSTFTSTVAMEWDLVCERKSLAPLFQTIFTGGCIFGCIMAAITAHRYGRRWAVRLGAGCTAVGVLVLTVAPWLSLVMVTRFLLGVSNTIMVYPGFMLSMEVCIPRLRSTVGLVLALPYAVMTVALTGLAYFIREWRKLHLATSFPCFLLLPVVLMVDESPRWLLLRGRIKEAVKVLERASYLNGVQLPELTSVVSAIEKKQKRRTRKQPEEEGTSRISQISCIGREMQNVRRGSEMEEEEAEKSVELGVEDGFGAWWAGPVALVSTSCMRRRMAVLVLLWLMMASIYLSVPLSSDVFSSPFLYMTLLGIVEVPAYTLSAPITRLLGRRSVIIFCFFISGLLLLSLSLKGINEEWLVLLRVMVSYLFICTAYQLNFLYASELLPTSLRPWGTAVCTLASYVGFSIPPLVTDNLPQDLQWLPPVLFGGSSIVCGFLVMLLPETNGRPLPETVADLRHQKT